MKGGRRRGRGGSGGGVGGHGGGDAGIDEERRQARPEVGAVRVEQTRRRGRRRDARAERRRRQGLLMHGRRRGLLVERGVRRRGRVRGRGALLGGLRGLLGVGRSRRGRGGGRREASRGLAPVARKGGAGRGGQRVLLEEERHLAAQSGVPGPALVLHGLAVHADGDAAAEAAGAALVAVRLVDEAAALRLGLAHVLPVAPDGALQ